MKRDSQTHLFVLIDALGWQFLKGREFLDDLLPYRTPLKTVLGFSSGAIPTILTGLPPSQNGHWNLFYYDPQGSPFRWLRRLSFLPNRMLDNRLTRKLLKEMGRRVLGLGPLFECCVSPRLLPLFNWVEKRNIYDRGGISGADSIFDLLSGRGIPYRVYTYHHGSDEEILRQALKDVRESKASFFFVYLSEMDMLLHDHWKNPRRAEQRLERYAVRLRELFDSAREIDFAGLANPGAALARVRGLVNQVGDQSAQRSLQSLLHPVQFPLPVIASRRGRDRQNRPQNVSDASRARRGQRH